MSTGSPAEVWVRIGCFAIVYLLHSTLLYASAWGLGRIRSLEAHRERFWKVAMVGALVTASMQVAGWRLSVFAPVTLHMPRTSTMSSVAETPPILAARLRVPAASSSPSAPPHSVWIQPPAANPPQGGTLPTPVEDLPLHSSAVPTSIASTLLSKWIDTLGRCFAVVLALALATTSWFSWRSTRRVRALLGARQTLRDPTALALLDELSLRAGLRRPPSLQTCDRLCVPLVHGLRRAEICLPDRALRELNAQELRCVLAHEIAHVARGDLIWRALRLWICGLFFFQPLHRIAARRMEELAEEACDDWAVEQTRDRVGMAACLAEVASWLRPPPLPIGMTAMAHSRSNLGKRIERLLDDCAGRSSLEVRRRAPWAAATLLFVPLFVAPPLVASPVSVRNQDTLSTASSSGTDSDSSPTTPKAGGAPIASVAQDPLVAAVAELREELNALDRELGVVRAERSKTSSSPEEVELYQRLEARSDALEAAAHRLDRWMATRATDASASAHDSPQDP